MSQVNPGGVPPITLSNKLKEYAPWVFAVIILISYGWFITELIKYKNAPSEEWTRLTYIFSSLEAIVFTAVGFIFGREVNRSRAIKAEKGEEKAKKEKQKLAKEILEQLPGPPDLDQNTKSITQIEGLRSLAKIYSQE